jgi:hypothetical protein
MFDVVSFLKTHVAIPIYTIIKIVQVIGLKVVNTLMQGQ